MTSAPYLAMLGSVVLTACAQLALKVASTRYASTAVGDSFLGGLIAQLLQPLTMAAITAYVGSMMLWLIALRSLPLSVAYTFSGVTIVAVVLMGVLVLGETLAMRQIAGSGMVIVGAYLVASH